MADLISRQAVFKEIESRIMWSLSYNALCEVIQDAPAADAVPIEKYNELKEQYERWKSVATIFGDALREYQRKYER